MRDGENFVVNGAKTFITNGFSANLVIVCAKTDPAAGRRGIGEESRGFRVPDLQPGTGALPIALNSQAAAASALQRTAGLVSRRGGADQATKFALAAGAVEVQAGQALADARVSRFYGGSSEIMQVIVATELGL